MESNKFIQHKLSDWERLESVITWANMTTNYFARHIGLARGENLYQIKRGNNNISRNIASMIVAKFPEINIVWLLTGFGEMFSSAEMTSGSKPLYNLGVEEYIREIENKQPDSQLILPQNIDCDMAMPYLGRAMNSVTPTNSVLLLKKILPEMIIPGDECVIVTKNFVLLRIVKLEADSPDGVQLRLVADNNQTYGDVLVSISEIESAYKVKGKILINN